MIKNKKLFSVLLITVIFLNSIISRAVYAAPVIESLESESSLTDGENTEEAIETTTEVLYSDETESSSGIIIDILDKVFKNKADDEVLSGAAIDYEIDDSMLPSYVSSLLEQKYSGLSDDEKFSLNTYLFVREDTMNICCDNRYSVRYSIPYALLMQTMEIDFDTAENMMVNYGSQKTALESANLYSERLYDYACFRDESIKNTVKDYIIDGYNIDDVLKAYGIAIYMGRDISDVIKYKYDGESLYTDIEITNDIINLCKECYINAETAKEILESDNYDNFIFDYNEILKTLKEGNNDVTAYADSAADEDIGYDSAFKKGALSYIKGVGANVDPNTGAVSYTENICSIPGIAGLDLNISLLYSSSANCSYRSIDSRANYGHNWRYSFPFITNEDGSSIINGKLRYLTLSNGDTYEMVSSTAAYYIPTSIYTDELKLYRDSEHQGGEESKYKLTYKNGNTDYFNDEGLWIKTVDKFGNKIEVIESGSGLMKIKDTNNNVVTIQRSGNVQTITRPDNSKITINYSKTTQGAYARYTLDKITYPENAAIEFTYEFSSKDNYRNALLNKIKTATGLEKHFKYGWTDKLKYSWNSNYEVDYEIDKYDYARITEEYLLNDSKVCDKKTYTYDSNFMVANSNFAVGCFCHMCECGLNDYGGVTWCENCEYVDTNNNNRPDLWEWKGCIRNCECDDCPCIAYYIGGAWDCFKNCEVNLDNFDCPYVYINMENGTNYSTTINNENGTSVKYTFNALKQNISIEEYSGSTLLNKTTKSYLNKNDNCDFPVAVTYTENGAERKETYTYTNKYDVKSYVVTTNNNKELSSVSYNYDYESSKSNYYGLCTKVTAKMNSGANVVQTNTLLSGNTSMSGKVIAKSVITRGGTKESAVSYTYDTKGRNTVRNDYVNQNESSNIKTTNTYSDTTGFGAMPVEIKIDGNSGSVKYTYDKLGNVLSVTNQNNCKTAYKYDGIGNVTRVGYCDSTGAEKSSVSLQYNYTENTIRFTNENGKVEVYEYDPVGNPEKVTKGGTVLSAYTYDTRLRPATYTEGKAKTVYTYDNRDRLTSEVIKEGTKVLSNKTYTYENNSTGLKTTEKINGDANSATVTNINQTDVLGRNVMTNYGGDIINYEYDFAGNVTKESQFVQTDIYKDKVYTYDSKGNILTCEESPSNNTDSKIITSASYDMLGRMTTSTDGKGNTTEYTYNALGLVTNKKVPFALDSSGNMQYTNYSCSYDAVGNVTRDTVTSGVVNTYSYDYRNRVTQAKSGEQSVNYVYDNVGNMIQYSAAGGTQVHKYAYDALNRVTKYTDALGNSEAYTYDSNQDMIKKVDRNGKAITYTYDGLHRVLTEKAEGVNNSWTYGLTGGVLTESNDNAVKTYTYNDKGLVHKETMNLDGTSFMIERYYDTRKNLRYNFYRKNGTNYRTVQYNYNNRGQLSAVKENENGGDYVKLVSYYYDNNGNLTSAHYGNNSYNVYYYDEANSVVSMYLKKKSDNSTLEHISYSYRADGNITSKTVTYGDDTSTTEYTYDSTGRLIRENVTGYDNFGIAYTYDSAGNRKSMTLSGNAGNYTENYTYDKNNRLTGSVKNYGKTSAYTDYTYDKNGNQTKIEKYKKNNEGTFKLGIISASYKNDTGEEKFTYNGLNRLTGYESTNGQYNGKIGLSAEYKYMANGYRLSKEVNGALTEYLWDGDDIAAELNSEEVISKSYTRGYNLIKDSSNIYYMHDIQGNVIETYGNDPEYPQGWHYYNAFGTNKYFENSDDINEYSKWGYCDQLYDWETNNYYMRARYYNPETGRFISEDTHWNPSNMIYGDRTFEEDETKYPDITASLQAGNLYGYCMGNPIYYVDITGNSAIAAGYLVYAAWIALNLVVDVAAGYVALKLTDLTIQEQNKLKKSVSYDRSRTISSYIDWDKDENGKNHVINGSKTKKGSKESHLPIWQKFGYDPNDPNGYNKLLELFKNVVNADIVIKNEEAFEHGKAIGIYKEYALDYVSKGARVIVKIYTSYKTGNVYFSDAWGELLK
ncbi:MAG: RHS repeat-associated core domain-containing protein [Clostridia bacterium]|nr:RHS repeat-associated core domain-containing protein [Clostridia bacterium]